MLLGKTIKRKRRIGFTLIVILLLNVVSSVALSSNSAQRNFAMLCTSQGLVKFALDNDLSDIPDKSNTNHCSFCTLFDHSIDTTNTELGYPQPQYLLSSLYKTPATVIKNRDDYRLRPLRAPPHPFSRSL